MPAVVTPAPEEEPELAADLFAAVEESEPFDVDEGDDDVAAAQAALDAAPCVRTRPGRKPVYKPGTRHLPPPSATAPAEGSWWTRPNADFAAEAKRMRDSGARIKVPGENYVIGMNGAGFR